jgi:hypothetical protein
MLQGLSTELLMQASRTCRYRRPVSRGHARLAVLEAGARVRLGDGGCLRPTLPFFRLLTTTEIEFLSCVLHRFHKR